MAKAKKRAKRTVTWAQYARVSAELAQERDIRREREATIEFLAETLRVPHEPHQTFFERLAQRALEVAPRPSFGGDPAKLAGHVSAART
jgi:hypothetical protein